MEYANFWPCTMTKRSDKREIMDSYEDSHESNVLLLLRKLFSESKWIISGTSRYEFFMLEQISSESLAWTWITLEIAYIKIKWQSSNGVMGKGIHLWKCTAEYQKYSHEHLSHIENKFFWVYENYHRAKNIYEAL